ncbi:hypothetical protein [Methylovorus mays]|uniref:hypothetical protein n=1 Tax=Methylovorus mays TaxID=184077 RepID=UPI001E5E44B1|nr:hypothetical protein [Methylovorus mays]MCB5206226.1 hypothetical protein [Methylovorus mays]
MQRYSETSLLVLICNLLFLTSLFLPAYTVGGIKEGASVMYGYNALLIGWLGPFSGEFTWYANLCYLMALKTKNITYALLWAVSGFGIALSFLFATETYLNEGVGNAPLQSYEAGYYFWLAAIGLLTIRQGIVAYSEAKKRGGNELKRGLKEVIAKYWMVIAFMILVIAGEIFTFSYNSMK